MLMRASDLYFHIDHPPNIPMLFNSIDTFFWLISKTEFILESCREPALKHTQHTICALFDVTSSFSEPGIVLKI